MVLLNLTSVALPVFIVWLPFVPELLEYNILAAHPALGFPAFSALRLLLTGMLRPIIV